MSQKINRLLLTGAAGGLGKALRPRLNQFAQIVRVSDVADLGTTAAHEEAVRCDLGNYDAMLALLDGVDAVVHLGGMSIDGPFEPILNANIRGAYNLYEGVRQKGVKRVVFASSNHVVGFHKQTDRLDATAPMRPDGNYGVSKAFGELLSRFYYDRYGVETVCMRIGSSFPKALDHRMLSTWLSYDDLVRLWNHRGSVVCAAQLTDRLHRGVVSAATASAEYCPMGEPGRSTDLGGCVNLLNPSKSISRKAHGIKPNTTLIQVEKWTGVDTWKPAEAANG